MPAKRKHDPNARRSDETYWQHTARLARQKADARDREQPLVTPEAEAHGDYRQDFVTHVETNTKAHTKVNRGGTPVERWANARPPRLSESQMVAIATCLRLWRLLGLRTPLTANYGQSIRGASVYELRTATETDAREDLNRIIDYFPGPLKSYWDVFENVCRHGIPAGTAGASLEYGSRSAEVRAHQIVCFVADVIATKERL